MTLLNSEIPKSESQLKPILHWNTNNTKINWQIRERNLCNTKPIHHLIPTESLFWNLYCIYVITGFVLDLSTKGRFSTQWVADYLKLPLRLERNSLCHKLEVGGELWTFFFSSSSLATSLKQLVTCTAALDQAPQLLSSAPQSSIQGTALRGSEGTATPGYAASTSLELKKLQQPLPWLEEQPGHGESFLCFLSFVFWLS